MKVPEESELKAVFDGRSLWEDIEYYCSSDRTLGSPLTARLFLLILSILWVALAEMEQTKAMGGKAVQVVPAGEWL